MASTRRASRSCGRATTADHAAPPAHAHVGILLRHLGWRTVPVHRRRWPGRPGKIGPLGFEPGHALAIRTGSRLGGTAGGEGERHEPGGVFSGEDSAAAGDAGHELHSAGGEVRPAGEQLPARQPDGTLKQGNRTQPAPPKEFNGGGGLYLDCRRLCALHADDPGQGPRREPGADPAGRRRLLRWRRTRSAR